jgi:RimJ/RimL family protein N-acetyltransferase
MTVELRNARPDDMRRVFEWRNLPEVVAWGAVPHTVTWQEHQRWFETVLAGGGHLLMIVMHEAREIGVVRFDRSSPVEAVISIYLVPDRVGRGLGVDAIRLACERIFAAWDVAQIAAHTRKDNRPAIRAFQKAGFTGGEPSGEDLLGWTLQRPPAA